MPTYTVTHSSLELNPEQKDQLAKGITEVHYRVTGANKYFAQVIFDEKPRGTIFMGGGNHIRTAVVPCTARFGLRRTQK